MKAQYIRLLFCLCYRDVPGPVYRHRLPAEGIWEAGGRAHVHDNSRSAIVLHLHLCTSVCPHLPVFTCVTLVYACCQTEAITHPNLMDRPWVALFETTRSKAILSLNLNTMSLRCCIFYKLSAVQAFCFLKLF